MHKPNIHTIKLLMTGHGDVLSERELAAIMASAVFVTCISQEAIARIRSGADDDEAAAYIGMVVGALELAGRWGWLDDDIEQVRELVTARLQTQGGGSDA